MVEVPIKYFFMSYTLEVAYCSCENIFVPFIIRKKLCTKICCSMPKKYEGGESAETAKI